MKPRVLIKLGGSSLQNESTLLQLTELLKGLQRSHDLIIVHGGGPAINAELTRRKIEWKFINGQRQTTPEMITVIEEVLAKNVNSMIVTALNKSSLKAVGISGAEHELLFCSQASEELMQVGKIEQVNTKHIEEILHLQNNTIPVLAPIGVDADNKKYNINADWAATKLAIALKVEKLIFLTDQNGILDHNSQLIATAHPELIKKLIQDGTISGGMYTKVMTMMSALDEGVQQVRVLNALSASQLLANENIGTNLTSAFN